MTPTTKQVPSAESERIKVLQKYEILDTPPDATLDLFTKMAAQITKMPIALISLVDTDRIWFKSRYGLELQETPRNQGFCSTAILSDEFYEVEDAMRDSSSRPEILVTGEMGLKFYAGVPLRTREGYNLGTLCVMGREPGKLSEDKKEILQNLAALVMRQIETKLEAKIAERHQLQMLHTTAHDLKNPLSSMPLLADMILQKKNEPETVGKIAERIKKAGRTMSDTIDDLLEAAKKETNKVHLQLEVLDFGEIVKRVISSNQALLNRKNQQVVFSEESQCSIYGDPRKLSEVVDNLVNNAIKYSASNTEIAVRLEKRGDTAVLEVRDQGPGLTSFDLANLFLPFTTLSAKPTGGESAAGLGLSIVKRLIEAHEGKVYAESEGSGKGSNFCVELPISKS